MTLPKKWKENLWRGERADDTEHSKAPARRDRKLALAMCGIYVLEFNLAMVVGGLNFLAKDARNPDSANEPKWAYTVAVVAISMSLSALGGTFYQREHLGRETHYVALGLFPVLYLVPFLMWIAHFGVYAYSFAKETEDHGSDMPENYHAAGTRITWASCTNVCMWFIIFLVSVMDWQKYGDYTRKQEKWVSERKKERSRAARSRTTRSRSGSSGSSSSEQSRDDQYSPPRSFYEPGY